MNTMTVQDLIMELEQFDPDMEVRIASQPSWPFEYTIEETAESDGVIYIAEGRQIGYLPGKAAEAVGWR